MKNLNRALAMAGAALLLGLGTNHLAAQQERQGRGNFDPEQMRQRMMERYREQLEIKGDDEWKVIQGRIEKVMAARREVGFGGRGFGGPAAFGRAGRPGRDGADAQRGGDDQGGRRAARGGFGGEPSAEVEALQKAIESNASADELKAKLAKVREARKQKEANLDKAQEELRQVLSVRQEASAVLMDLLR